MIDLLLSHPIATTAGIYLAVMAFIALLIAAEGQRNKERGR